MKRLITYLRNRLFSGRNPPPEATEPPGPTDDPSTRAYRLVFTVGTVVPEEPLDTFAERSREGLRKAIAETSAYVENTLLYPDGRGNVNHYPADEDTPSSSRPN